MLCMLCYDMLCSVFFNSLKYYINVLQFVMKQYQNINSHQMKGRAAFIGDGKMGVYTISQEKSYKKSI